MKPKRIFLIRHGQSEGNVDHNIYATTPDYEVNLTALGKEQALAAGKEIKELVGNESVWCYVSPYARTRQTYYGIRVSLEDQLVKTVEDPRLREQDFGHLTLPEPRDEIIQKRDLFGTFYYRMPDGESGADVFDRISTFLETMHRDFDKASFADNVVIVTHGLALRMFLMRWFHMTVEEYECLKNPANCQIVIMVRQANDKYRIIQGLESYPEPRHIVARRKL